MVSLSFAVFLILVNVEYQKNKGISAKKTLYVYFSDADQLHVALDSFNSHFQQKLINLTLLWYFQPVDW